MQKINGARRRAGLRGLAVIAAGVLLAGMLPSAATSAEPAQSQADPRVGLGAGWLDAQQAASGLKLVGHQNRPEGFFQAENPGNLAFANSDLALGGKYVFVGNFHGFNIYDVSKPSRPALKTSVVCPGGQGDLSVYGNLLFMSVEENRGRLDCGTQGNPTTPSPERFRGVRIFDVSDISRPVQVAAVQTCRGSHTHSVVTSKKDRSNVYIYVSGTAGVRSGDELAGCVNAPATDLNTALWRIEVIKVPLATPQNAAIVNRPRVFIDPVTGAINGLQNAPPAPTHPSGAPWGPQPVTSACHDLTAFPALNLVAGACAGNGILLDTTDPASPVRLDEVSDPNFAYWHSATLSNDGKKVVFTDEWGGGTGPRCRDTDEPSWGANAIFDIVNGKMQFRSYYKMPAVQTTMENCVAHNGSLVPVPGRDIMVQGWYQGGVSAFDFTDSAKPKEIAFFDRGPISATALVTGGIWSAYYYNGHVYGSEIARGLDVFELTPTKDLAKAEIAAAAKVKLTLFNAQHQPQVIHQPSFEVVRAYQVQAERAGTMKKGTAVAVDKLIDSAKRLADRGLKKVAAIELRAAARLLKTSDPAQAAFAKALNDLARALD